MPACQNWTQAIIQHDDGENAEAVLAVRLGLGDGRAVTAQDVAGGGEQRVQAGQSLPQQPFLCTRLSHGYTGDQFDV
jgi:hypothetical protein